jgi:hypothetical protein
MQNRNSGSISKHSIDESFTLVKEMQIERAPLAVENRRYDRTPSVRTEKSA